MPETKRPLKVFLCHASQDKQVVRELSGRLASEGWIDPWLDEKKLLPGQNWRFKIEEAVETSDIVIVCVSSTSVTKEGFVQKELRYATDIALEKPDETIFLIPLRLDDCETPRGLRSYQRVDYFGGRKNEAYAALIQSLKLRHEQKLGAEGQEGDHTSTAPSDGHEREMTDKGLFAKEKPLRILVTGGKKTSPTIDNLASLIGYQIILRGHIMLNHGTKGIDKAAAKGALKACQEKGYLPEDLIHVYRPENGSIPDFSFGRLNIIGKTFHERRDLVIDQSDAVILLSGGQGTRNTAKQVRVAKKPLIPIGVGNPKEAAVEIWQQMLVDADSEDSPIGRHDLRKLGPSDNHERLAINTVILAENLARKQAA
jgi:predicted Rossmann-fold nucleotide-binding protein